MHLSIYTRSALSARDPDAYGRTQSQLSTIARAVASLIAPVVVS